MKTIRRGFFTKRHRIFVSFCLRHPDNKRSGFITPARSRISATRYRNGDVMILAISRHAVQKLILSNAAAKTAQVCLANVI